MAYLITEPSFTNCGSMRALNNADLVKTFAANKWKVHGQWKVIDCLTTSGLFIQTNVLVCKQNKKKQHGHLVNNLHNTKFSRKKSLSETKKKN